MPDFTICTNKNCPVQDGCYRFLAKPNELHQSFAVFHPLIDAHDNFVDCDYFKPLPEFEKKKKNSNKQFF